MRIEGVVSSKMENLQHARSDIDLVMYADRMKLSDLNSVNTALDELYLPYTFDLSFFHHIENADLLQHIARVGKVFYQRSSEGK